MAYTLFLIFFFPANFDQTNCGVIVLILTIMQMDIICSDIIATFDFVQTSLRDVTYTKGEEQSSQRKSTIYDKKKFGNIKK